MSDKRVSIILRGEPAQLEAASKALRQAHPEVELDPGADPGTGRAPDLGLLFEHAPVALILVDAARRVLRINREAAGLAGQVPRDMLDQITGVAIGCANAHVHPDGCGHSPACGQCGLRQIIEATFDSGTGQRQVETRAAFGAGQAQHDRRLRVSTSLVALTGGTFGLLALEEISDSGLPTGDPPPPRLPSP